MAKRKKTAEIKLTSELALCSKVMVNIFEKVYKDSDLEEYRCTDDYYIKVSPRLAEHLYDHSYLELANADPEDREGWIKKCIGQIVYFSHNDLPITEEELLSEDAIGDSSAWKCEAWTEYTPSDLYWWVDNTIETDEAFSNYGWYLFLQSLGLIQRMVKDGLLTIEEVWEKLNAVKEKKENGIFFEGWMSTPMPGDLCLDNFVHYLFEDIFTLLYSHLDDIEYLVGLEDDYFKVLNHKLIDKFLDINKDYDFSGKDPIRLRGNIGKYVYASWGGDPFTEDEMDDFEWDGLYFYTEEELLDVYKKLPLYVRPKECHLIYFIEGSAFIAYMIIAYKLAILNGKTDEDFVKQYSPEDRSKSQL